ncbi:hypothetical protein AE621_04550, partial [Acidovorax sp. SD340]
DKTKPFPTEEFDFEKAWGGTEADGFAARVKNDGAWKVSIAQIRPPNGTPHQKTPPVGKHPSPAPGVGAAQHRPRAAVLATPATAMAAARRRSSAAWWTAPTTTTTP